MDNRSALTAESAMMTGMISGMTKRKIAVSLPEEQVAAAQAAVAEGRAASVSAYVSKALETFEQADGLDRYLALADAEFGPVRPEAKAWVKAELDRLEARAKDAG